MNERHIDDCGRIVRVAAANGYPITINNAYKLWSEYSDSYAAGWLYLPEKDEDLFSRIGGSLPLSSSTEDLSLRWDDARGVYSLLERGVCVETFTPQELASALISGQYSLIKGP